MVIVDDGRVPWIGRKRLEAERERYRAAVSKLRIEFRDAEEVLRRLEWDLSAARNELEARQKEYQTRSDAADRQCAELNGEIRALRQQNAHLVELASRPPVIVDPAASIQAMGEAFSKTLAPNFDSTKQNEGMVETEMGSLGLDNQAGVKAGVWYPDVEFDKWIADRETMPTRGGWVADSPTPASLTGEPLTENEATGLKSRRPPGSAPFRTGGRSDHPAGGVE